MLAQHSLDQQITQQETKINELAIQLESLEDSVSELMKFLNVTSEQLTTFISKPENFTEQNWNDLVKQKKLLDDKLHRELANIRNPLQTKKSYSNLHVERHWLHVR